MELIKRITAPLTLEFDCHAYTQLTVVDMVIQPYCSDGKSLGEPLKIQFKLNGQGQVVVTGEV